MADNTPREMTDMIDFSDLVDHEQSTQSLTSNVVTTATPTYLVNESHILHSTSLPHCNEPRYFVSNDPYQMQQQSLENNTTLNLVASKMGPTTSNIGVLTTHAGSMNTITKPVNDSDTVPRFQFEPLTERGNRDGLSTPTFSEVFINTLNNTRSNHYNTGETVPNTYDKDRTIQDTDVSNMSDRTKSTFSTGVLQPASIQAVPQTLPRQPELLPSHLMPPVSHAPLGERPTPSFPTVTPSTTLPVVTSFATPTYMDFHYQQQQSQYQNRYQQRQQSYAQYPFQTTASMSVSPASRMPQKMQRFGSERYFPYPVTIDRVR